MSVCVASLGFGVGSLSTFATYSPELTHVYPG
eukprot:COSAG02_NODE_44323_length_367_cov_0.776119_2_plen_31_part_01